MIIDIGEVCGLDLNLMVNPDTPEIMLEPRQRHIERPTTKAAQALLTDPNKRAEF